MSHGYCIRIIMTIMGIINERDTLLEKKILCVSTLLPIALRHSTLLSSTGPWDFNLGPFFALKYFMKWILGYSTDSKVFQL